jgi:hypothetical protein
MKYFLLILSLSFFPFNHVSGQISQNQISGKQMAFYNISLGSIAGGAGALINMKPGDRWYKVLLKGMGQGALGGFLVYESKNLVSHMNLKPEPFDPLSSISSYHPLNEKPENLARYSWYGKIVNATGTSIIENAALNKNFWEKWHIQFGFNRIEVNTVEKPVIKYRIMPVSLVFTISAAIGGKFELKRSLQTGMPVFSRENFNKGVASGNIITIDSRYVFDSNLNSHEIIHVYQYYDFNFINSFLDKPRKHLAEKSPFIKNLNKIFYFDMQELIFWPAYNLENRNRDCYYDNFFEYEAGWYSRTISCR